MEPGVAISIRGLRKSYGIVEIDGKKKKHVEYPIFEGIDLDVMKGDIVAILGRNGCGKSTFLKMVSGIIEPDAGTVEVDGKIASILELSMGFHGDLSGRDNIFLRSELYGIPRKEVERRIDDIVAYTDLGVYIDNPVRTYSSGMRSRLAFSVMVNVDADIYLVDEALSTGDMAFASKASEHLKELVRSGKTVLFTSHSMGTIRRTCSRAIWINNHTIAMDGPADEVCDAYQRSINDSVEETMSLAEGGSSSAQYRLSTFYRDGNGVEMDEAQRRRWLEEAAKRDHPMAQCELADIILAEGDEEAAADLYRKAADNGSNDARRKHATLSGEVRHQAERIRSILKEQTASGYPYDFHNYAMAVYRSALTADDYREALEYFQKASEIGWLDSDVVMADMYREGQGVPRDFSRYVEILKAAAEAGHPRAMSKLAEFYSDGKYVAKDQPEAFKWHLLSARAGNAKSQYQVAAMYSNGIGVEKDPEAAKQWFATYSSTVLGDSRKAAMEVLKHRRGDLKLQKELLKESSLCFTSQSMVSLALRYATGGKDGKPNPHAGFDLMSKAAVIGGAPRARLAEFYRDGIGVQKDEAKAFSLMRNAAAMGDASALYGLALMYKDGTGVESDEEQYRRYMRMAAERGNRDARDTVKQWEARKERRKKTKETKRWMSCGVCRATCRWPSAASAPSAV